MIMFSYNKPIQRHKLEKCTLSSNLKLYCEYKWSVMFPTHHLPLTIHAAVLCHKKAKIHQRAVLDSCPFLPYEIQTFWRLQDMDISLDRI